MNRISLPALSSIAVLAAGFLAPSPAPAASSRAPASVEVAALEPRSFWVYFADKDLATSEDAAHAIARAEAELTPRARERRLEKRIGAASSRMADLLDVPVAPRYLAAVLATGATLRHPSRWLNAVSVRATDAELDAIRALPFVASTREVATARHETPFIEPESAPEPAPASPRSLNYGQCASQIIPIQVNQLHDSGLSGAGVLIAVFDTGFLRTHDALDGVTVSAEHDFVQNDGVTSNQPGDDESQHNHGTMCLSLIGGNAPGNLIGPAYGATYVLGKTETISSETPAEEDNWVAAAEWAEGLGVDVISSSLGYLDWYTYDDMDGETAPITIAADLAVQNGVSVFTAAGNEGDNPWFYIIAPADGDFVMSIGAVDSLGGIASFSSHGPTSDGRIKPDVCAMGRGDLIALPWDNFGYGRGSGTSFATPLAAGVAALLLQAHPSWGPLQVRDALRSTATKSSNPDNSFGWGVIRGANARNVATGAPEIASGGVGEDDARVTVSPNPSHDVSVVRFSLPAGSRLREAGIYDVAGRRLRSLSVNAATGVDGTIAWNGRDDAGRNVPSGLYFAKLDAENAAGEGRSIEARIVRLR